MPTETEAPAEQADLTLVDDFAFDARTLSSEVTRRLMLQSPTNDDWR